MATYRVRLILPHQPDQVISVSDDEYILDIAEDAGIDLPAGCRQGNCSSCLAHLIDGSVNQEEQRFLSEAEINEGYTVTCVAMPSAHCTLATHQEKYLYQKSLYHTS